MSDNTAILVRNAREQDIPAVVEIDAEAFSPHGTAETPETFQLRLTAFPDGFIILVADNEIAAYGCSEKWLDEHELGLDENPLAEQEPGLDENPLSERESVLDEKPLATHQPDGRIFCITGMAVKVKYRGRGYGLLILDKLIEIAHGEGCNKIVLETTHAQGLYLKRGFKTVQNRTERGISLDVMSLDLKPTSRN